jgi:hypothetical protein
MCQNNGTCGWCQLLFCNILKDAMRRDLRDQLSRKVVICFETVQFQEPLLRRRTLSTITKLLQSVVSDKLVNPKASGLLL